MTRIIVRTCAGREHLLPYLKAHMPMATEYCFDDTGRGGMGNFLKSLRMTKTEPVVMMEDDIRITQGFGDKLSECIRRNPRNVIQFFSRNGDDTAIGSRWMPGGSFSNNQCHYMPAGVCSALLAYYPSWVRRKEHPHGYDLLIADFLRQNRQRYWQCVPSLVDHLTEKSVISPGRSTKRQSLTFLDPVLE